MPGPKTALDDRKQKGKTGRLGPFCKYPEHGNAFLPANFNAGLRAGSGFL